MPSLSWLRIYSFLYAPQPLPGKGAGLGGKDGEQTCPKCSNFLGQPISKLGHACVTALIARGRDPQHAGQHTGQLFIPDIPEKHSYLIQKTAAKQLQKKNEGGLNQKRRRMK